MSSTQNDSAPDKSSAATDPGATTPRALVFAHEPDGPANQIERRLIERGWTVDTHVITEDFDQPNVANPFPEVEDYDLIVPMGSVRSLTEKDEIGSWIHVELEILRTAHEAGTPILGICFGGQLLADALGGSVEKAPVTEIGWFEIEPVDGQENPVGAGPWMEWHHDRFTPPPGADVLAKTENAVQLFRMGTTVGTQFHPEVDVAHVSGFLQHAPDEYLAENGVKREEMLADVQKHEAASISRCHALVDWFLDEVIEAS